MEESVKARIKKMLEKSSKKLEAAKKNFELGLYDETISRAYYAMFHAAKALLLTKNIEPRTHKGVITMLGEHFINEGILPREFGKVLSYVKDYRENGDYDEYFDADEELAKDIIKDSEKFVSKIKKILK